MTQRRRVQGKPFSRARAATLPCCLAAVLSCGGCERAQVDRVTEDPIAWWHDAQGGAIAQQRAPAPNAGDDYPNLGTVPARPVLADPVLRQSIADGLVADRANAERLAAASPLPDPTSPAASPAAFGRTAPAAAAPAAPPLSASFDAVNPVPPKSATATATAPQSPPAEAERTAPKSSDRTTSAAPLLPVPIPDAPVPDAVMPPLPSAAPASPRLPGASVTAMPAPRVFPRAPVGPPAPRPPPGPPLPIAFPAGSADLPDTQRATVLLLAASRGQSAIGVTGFGEAAAASPEAQAAALTLGLSRASAVGRLLVADGVEPASLRLSAEPAGAGAVARLLSRNANATTAPTSAPAPAPAPARSAP